MPSLKWISALAPDADESLFRLHMQQLKLIYTVNHIRGGRIFDWNDISAASIEEMQIYSTWNVCGEYTKDFGCFYTKYMVIRKHHLIILFKVNIFIWITGDCSTWLNYCEFKKKKKVICYNNSRTHLFPDVFLMLSLLLRWNAIKGNFRTLQLIP